MPITKSAVCFVHLSHPTDASKQKKIIRSHAAKNAVIRQQRVINYQNAKAMRSFVGGAQPSLRVPVALNSPVLKFERFLLHHCTVTASTDWRIFMLTFAVVVHVIGQAVTCLPFGTVPSTLDMRRDLSNLWVQMAVVDRGVAAALFLNACRHLVHHTQQKKYNALILKYKGECIGNINLSLSKQGHAVTDVTIVKTLILASDAVREPINSFICIARDINFRADFPW